jgi:hypothetical protein
VTLDDFDARFMRLTPAQQQWARDLHARLLQLVAERGLTHQQATRGRGSVLNLSWSVEKLWGEVFSGKRILASTQRAPLMSEVWG